MDTPTHAPATAATPDTALDLRVLRVFMLTGIAVFALMMLVGLVMRMTQATWLALPPTLFYQLMTLHGAGMVGTAGLGGALVMWYFLRRHVELSGRVFLAMFALSLVGVVLIVAGILVGGFAAGWTFLYPLPARPMGLWPIWSAVFYVLGLTCIGVAFLLFYADAALAIVKRHGSLMRALGLPQLFGGITDPTLPPTVVASTMVIVVNVLGILAGAVVLVMTLVNLLVPSMAFDALLMKNLIYFFGHVFINASIYMAVIAVYELLPRYTGRPWKISRPFLAAWAAAVLMVTAVYPHHLLMDFAMPAWALALGQVLSYLSGIPVLLVTAWGALANIHRSGLRWDGPSRLLVFGVFGWAVGVIPAIIDGTIRVNAVMHNTLWVPGHFHIYLLLGLLPMLFGFMLHVVGARGESSARGAGRAAFWAYGLAGTMFCLSFLWGGYRSVPRRWAEHAPEWVGVSQFGSVAAAIVVLAAVVLALQVLSRLSRAELSPAR